MTYARVLYKKVLRSTNFVPFLVLGDTKMGYLDAFYIKKVPASTKFVHFLVLADTKFINCLLLIKFFPPLPHLLIYIYVRVRV